MKSRGFQSVSVVKWLGWKDSNFRMLESESRALPLGDTPINEIHYNAK